MKEIVDLVLTKIPENLPPYFERLGIDRSLMAHNLLQSVLRDYTYETKQEWKDITEDIPEPGNYVLKDHTGTPTLATVHDGCWICSDRDWVSYAPLDKDKFIGMINNLDVQL